MSTCRSPASRAPDVETVFHLPPVVNSQPLNSVHIVDYESQGTNLCSCLTRLRTTCSTYYGENQSTQHCDTLQRILEEAQESKRKIRQRALAERLERRRQEKMNAAIAALESTEAQQKVNTGTPCVVLGNVYRGSR